MVGTNFDKAGLFRTFYNTFFEIKSDKALERNVRDYEEFQQLPLSNRIFAHLTLRAPSEESYNYSLQELEVRRGKREPLWYQRREAFMNRA